ncbi:MAG: hypothetical protein N3B21_10405 [Clostridia bacterium]|nr:hypothetical protein [Clostridia bacterium]
MSIKPIDFQVMIPKTSEVSKIHSEEQQRNQSAQQHQQSVVQQKADLNLRQVHSQDKVNNAGIKEKQEKGQQNKKDDKRKNKRNNAKSSGNETSTIDIRL